MHGWHEINLIISRLKKAREELVALLENIAGTFSPRAASTQAWNLPVLLVPQRVPVGRPAQRPFKTQSFLRAFGNKANVMFTCTFVK